jgi:hypothetical protein
MSLRLGASSRTGVAPGRWSALDKGLFGALVLGGVLSVPLLVHPYYDAVGDGSIYLVTARALLDGDGYVYLEMPFRERPPGLSALIAPVLAVFGENQAALNTLILLFGLLCVALIFVHQRSRIGGPLALLVSLAIWLNPGFQKYSTQILSDVPGLAAAFACLLVARHGHRAPSLRREIALGICIGLATYLRSGLMLLLPALWLARLLGPASPDRTVAAVAQFALRRMLPVGVVVWAVMLPWMLRDAAVMPEAPVDQAVIYDYATAQWHTSWTDPDSPLISFEELLTRVEQRSRQLVKSLGSRMQWGTRSEAPSSRAFDPVETLVTLLLLSGLVWQAVRRRDMASFFALGTLGVLLIYFDYHARLALPIYVIALAGCVERSRSVIAHVWGNGRGSLVVGLVLAGLILWDFDPRRSHALAESKDIHLRERCVAVERIGTDHTRFATTVGWHYSMCLGRPVFGLAQRIVREANASAAESVIDLHRVDTVFLDTTSAYDARFAPYFELRYGPALRSGVIQYWRVRTPAADPPDAH